jgi:hypothetical protein
VKIGRGILGKAALLEQWDNVEMNAPQPVSPRRRLQELLAIPDNQRTEAQWDELNELEIKLAPGNREPGNREDNLDQMPPRNNQQQAGRGESRGGPAGKRLARKFHKRPPKTNPP